MSVIASPLSDGDRVVARSVVEPESDWRPLPSCAEVLAHNARTGGGEWSPWLWLRESDDARGVSTLHVVHMSHGGIVPEVRTAHWNPVRTDPFVGVVRPITRRGEALPWPEVPR